MSTQTSPNSYTVLEGQKVGDFEDKLESSRKAKDRYTNPITRSPTSPCASESLTQVNQDISVFLAAQTKQTCADREWVSTYMHAP